VWASALQILPFVDQSVELEVLFVDRYGSAAVSVDEFFLTPSTSTSTVVHLNVPQIYAGQRLKVLFALFEGGAVA